MNSHHNPVYLNPIVSEAELGFGPESLASEHVYTALEWAVLIWLKHL